VNAKEWWAPASVLDTVAPGTRQPGRCAAPPAHQGGIGGRLHFGFGREHTRIVDPFVGTGSLAARLRRFAGSRWPFMFMAGGQSLQVMTRSAE
jgi:hypothetical protein